MTCHQPPPDPFDLTTPMILPAGSIANSVDPSDLMSTFPSSDADWMGKESLDLLPWDLSGNNEQQAFNLSDEVAEGLEFQNPYSNSDYASPMGYRGYTVTNEDALSYASPVSEGESGTWSPTHHNDKSNSQSPAAADNIKVPSSATSPSTSHRHVGSRPLATAGSHVAPAENTVYQSSSSSSPSSSHQPRKLSNATASSSSPSSLPAATTTQPSSSYQSNPRPARSASEADPAAVMKRKKAAHNAIEKRYRTNMNAKFLALGNSIPRPGPFATQLASNKGSRKHSLCTTRDSLANGVQQQQQNKSEILTNALAYIQELQEENSRLKGELMVLKENLLPRGNIMWRR
ncbi:hypothetical protein PISL3812_04677 [Talaromyces islandicus]|uniref:BHLH domain-containing protein n=1 Tax=Talaromyces islandicus TaxID=28573 RepID=A0A0U1LW71_TALIS|nr:hypothetical protein PISL3812_04677 [Talaromyces islandicus]